MELLKLGQRPAEYQYGDVTILFRPVASTGDKFALDTLGEFTDKGKVKVDPWKFYKEIIRLFVVGWKGVTEDGKEVPYDFDTLVNRLPTLDDDLIMKLGLFIAETTGIYKAPEVAQAEKND